MTISVSSWAFKMSTKPPVGVLMIVSWPSIISALAVGAVVVMSAASSVAVVIDLRFRGLICIVDLSGQVGFFWGGM